ncbi:3,4-dihydroxy-2-butanone 4-phosphate synthase [Rhodococcus wratislaviensis]|uniref:3,4-dihydroxy-2-butanone-4-phosphate synthase n=1 Tax=Rhodococcus wratislaviensis TaxID=44752 RepID=A0AB38F6D1_RHOWR|nr:3,4-dihydroxy-2-butanone-4-phosphate synthase [Rhodococcus wratislaviensis]REE77576.1 3,4-dihydroxy-2-butanone 4-phosphate synthase [Rhodococcus wratislaviensis]SPZ35219.1 3,4-dihydroxy-2-butanone 4-phosphate synthase [Rhodococcus wratislaviensis]
MTTLLAPRASHHRSWSTLAAGSGTLADGELIILSHHRRVVLVGCAGAVTTEQMAFLIRHTTGFVQVALHERVCDRLVLPEATPRVRAISTLGHGQCVTVDAAAGITTGISGADRARTARILADPATEPDDLTRPGHLVPVRVTPTEFRIRATTASLALTLTDTAEPPYSGAVFADLDGIADPTSVGDRHDAEILAGRYGLTLVAGPNLKGNVR